MTFSDGSTKADPWPLAVFDWGTTNLHLSCVTECGKCLYDSEFAMGAKSLARHQFSQVFAERMSNLRTRFGCRHALLIGMVGSNLGWHDLDMIPASADPAYMADNLFSVPLDNPDLSASIVPGIYSPSIDGGTGMMRGEETQIIGVSAVGRTTSGLFCMPGTHTKWVAVEKQAVTSITTAMTGEVFDLLQKHSVLASSVEGDNKAVDNHAFAEGLKRAQSGLGAMQMAFSIRPQELVDGHRDPVAAQSHLSGLMIGSEVTAMLAAQPDISDVTLVGGEALNALYARAFKLAGVTVQQVNGGLAVREGARAIHAARLAKG